MKKAIFFACIGICISSIFAQKTDNKKYNRQVRKLEKQLTSRAYKQHKSITATNKTPDLYWVQEYIATMDPKLKRPTPEELMGVLEKLNKQEAEVYGAMPGTNVTAWVSRGPSNVGGRTRALAWDPTAASGTKVWAGGVTGGLWYTTDITNGGTSWQHVSSVWSNLSVSAIAFDPNAPGTMYVGTGEGYGSGTSTSRGFGIWKSTDSGKTFTQLSSTTSYYYVNDIVVRNESGTSVVYAAVDANYHGGQWHGTSSYGLFRSTNGGSSWTSVSIGNAPNGQKYAFADLELAADNALWAGTRNNPFSGTDKGGGRVLTSTNGTTWTVKYTLPSKPGRVEIACAPGSSYLVYAAFEFSGKCDTILVTHTKGASWAKLAKPVDADNGISKWDFTRNQAWYDLIIAVDPNDTNKVLIGGIDLFRSTNGGSSWTQISKWSNNNNLAFLNCSYVHADHHEIVFMPGSSSVCIFGTDGGVFYTNNLSAAATSQVIAERTKNYVTTQFYWGDMAAASGSNLMLGGAQDNGTVRITAAGLASSTTVSGGDGGNCFISGSNSSRQISSYVYNTYYYTLNNWTNTGNLISDGATGKFINPADWDDNGQGLFSGKSQGNLYRIKLISSPGTLETITWTATGAPSSVDAFKLSNGKTRLFCGTDAGKLYVTEDAWATSPSFSDITGTINAGNISDVYNLRSGDTIAAVLSNYGIFNVYVSTNGGSSWAAKDNNLPNQPVWSIVLNPNKIGEAVIATETGVYGTTNIFAASPVWSAYTEGMGAVKIATLRYRTSDKMLMAATHGRGIFTSDAWAKSNPITQFSTPNKDVCTNQNVKFTDSTLNDPTQWTWSFSPNTVVYLNGTDSSSQHPTVRFTEGGNYSVTLIAANALAATTLTKSNYIKVTDTIPGILTLSASADTLCAGDSLHLTLAYDSTLNSSFTSLTWKRNATTIAGSELQKSLVPFAGDEFSVLGISNAKCVSPANITSNLVKPIVISIVNASADIQAPIACSGKPLTLNAVGVNTGVTPIWSWYVADTLQSETSTSLTLTTPKAGDKVWATVFVPGRCVLPANLISSDTHTIVVNPTPNTPAVSRNFDTLFASNVGTGNYTWYRFGSVIGTGMVFRAPQNGNYRCVYSENSCSSDSSALIVFNSLQVRNGNAAANGIWPVPANDKLFVNDIGRIVSARIFTLSGQEVQQGWINKTSNMHNNQSEESIEIDIRSLSAGTYILRIANQSGQKEYRFVKQP